MSPIQRHDASRLFLRRMKTTPTQVSSIQQVISTNPYHIQPAMYRLPTWILVLLFINSSCSLIFSLSDLSETVDINKQKPQQHFLYGGVLTSLYLCESLRLMVRKQNNRVCVNRRHCYVLLTSSSSSRRCFLTNMAKWKLCFLLLLPQTLCFGITDSEGNVEKLVFIECEIYATNFSLIYFSLV